MSIPNAGPDIPYVTTVPTSYIGPSVSVAGVLWYWSAGLGEYTSSSAYDVPGSSYNPFASTTERDAWAAANPVELKLGLEKYGPDGIKWAWRGPAAGVWDVVATKFGLGGSPMVYGRSLWDPAGSVAGMAARETDLTLVSSGGTYYVTGYIPVIPGHRIITDSEGYPDVAPNLGTVYPYVGIYYNAAKVAISGMTASIDHAYDYVSGLKTYVVPPDAAFIRMTAITGSRLTIIDLDDRNPEDTMTWFGDSITFGLYASSNRSFAVLLAERLGVSLQNLGISSSRVAETSLGDTATFNPICDRIATGNKSSFFVGMLAGINDCGNGIALGTISDTAKNTFYGALDSCAKQMLTQYPFARIVWVSPLYSSVANPTNQPSYRDAVAAVASKYGIEYWDSAESRISARAKNMRSLVMTSDQLHPTDLGHKVLCDWMYSRYMFG